MSATVRGASGRISRPPPDPAWFTGREAELARLAAVASGPEHAPTLVIEAVDGLAGIGTTALAVHATHRLVDRYPDGQLLVDLRGGPGASDPVEPVDVLDQLLRELGVPGDEIPIDLADCAERWRAAVGGRRMVVVLDNAGSAAQVAPLLPGPPGCLVLVTGRRLTGVAATHTLLLDTLPADDAAELFARITGIAGEIPELVAELCRGTPLAIRLIAAQASRCPAEELSALVARLRDQDRQVTPAVTAALAVSYERLTTDQRGMYRRLGLHPGPDVDPHAAAALAGTTVERAAPLLERLHDVHLVQQRLPGRYVMHDLVRTHAATTAAGYEDEPARRAALGRLCHYYRYAASVAMDHAYPYERDRRPGIPPPATPVPDLAGPGGAIAWLDTELTNLVASARYAAAEGLPDHLELAATLHRHLRNRGRYRAAEALHQQRLATARPAGDQAGALAALSGLGDIHRLQGRHDAALDEYGRALAVARATGHRPGELEALRGLGMVNRRKGRPDQAIDDFGQALEVARAIGHRPAELNALNGLGDIHRRQGRYEPALDCFGQSLEIAHATGHRPAELSALNGLGDIHRRQGRHGAAADRYQQVLDLARDTGDRSWQLEARHGLGRLHQAAGDPGTALAHHRHALDLATGLGLPAEQARAHAWLGEVRQALGHREEARGHWQHALDILASLGTDRTEDEVDASAIRAHLRTDGEGQ